jgi:prephenate dehydrogenase
MNIYIIGLGFIGSSIARAIRKKQLNYKIYGCDVDLDSVKYAMQKNIIDESFSYENIDLDTSSNSLIIVAASPSASATIFRQLQHLFNIKSLAITDVCSIKNHLLNELSEANTSNIVFSHPMAGSHLSGVESGNEDLFKNKYVLISPFNSEDNAIIIVENFWRSLDVIPHRVKAKDHDSLLSATSHLPHILVYALLKYLQEKDIQDVEKVSGGGLQSLLRIGSSSPKMWSDIFLSNKTNLTKDIDGIIESLNKLKKEINIEASSLEALLNSLKNFKEETL